MVLLKIGKCLTESQDFWARFTTRTNPAQNSSAIIDSMKDVRYAHNLSCDTVQLAQRTLDLNKLCTDLCEQKIGGKPYPEEVDIVINNIRRNSNNTEVIIQRYNKLAQSNNPIAYILCERDFPNSDFLIENLEVFDNAFYRQIRKASGPDINTIIQNLNKEKLDLLIASRNDANKFKEITRQILYESSKHNIELGTRTVTVDSSDVIAIISGKQSLSYFNSGNSKAFEKTVKTITEVSEYKEGEQYYYQIAEGILHQHPELTKIVDELNITLENSNLPIKETLTKFFKEKELSGELPKTLTLRTVVPDENAMLYPSETFEIFKQRLAKR